MRLCMKDKAPIVKKLDKIFALMEKEGISIDCLNSTGTFVTNTKTGQVYSMEDLESDGSPSCEIVSDWPPALEYKLVIDENVRDTHKRLPPKKWMWRE